MPIAEIYIYPFDRKFVSMISLIKLYRSHTGYGLAESKNELERVSFDSRTREYYNYGRIKTDKPDMLFATFNDIRLAMKLNEELKELGCNTEVLYNGNMKTLDILYGK